MPSRTTERGFSLPEMALLTVVIGLILLAIVPRIIKNLERAAVKTQRKQATEARNEVIGTVFAQQALPDTAAFDNRNLRDKFDQPYRYFPHSSLTEAGLGSNSIQDQPDTNLSVVLPGGQTVSNVAFVVISPGANRQYETATTGDVADLNTDDSSTQVTNPTTFTLRNLGDTLNDDVVEYVTKDYLEVGVPGAQTAPASQESDPTPFSDAIVHYAGFQSGSIDYGGPGLGDNVYTDGNGDVAGTLTGSTQIEVVDNGQGTSVGEFDNPPNSPQTECIELDNSNGNYNMANFTITGWFRAQVYDDFNVITSKEIDSNNRNWWITIWEPNFNQGNLADTSPINYRHTYGGNELAIKASNGGGGANILHFGTTNGTREGEIGVADDTWHWFFISRNDTRAVMYVDNVLQSVQTNPHRPEMGSSQPVLIGCATGHSTTRAFNGQMDELLFYNATPWGPEDRTEYWNDYRANYGR